MNDDRARTSSPHNVRLVGCLALILHAVLFRSAAVHLHELAWLAALALAWTAVDALLLGAWLVTVERARRTLAV